METCTTCTDKAASLVRPSLSNGFGLHIVSPTPLIPHSSRSLSHRGLGPGRVLAARSPGLLGCADRLRRAGPAGGQLTRPVTTCARVGGSRRAGRWQRSILWSGGPGWAETEPQWAWLQTDFFLVSPLFFNGKMCTTQGLPLWLCLVASTWSHSRDPHHPSPECFHLPRLKLCPH